MRSFSVVPDEPRDQSAIELIGGDKQLLMVINEFFLNGSIKPFDLSIHFGRFGIAVPMVFVCSRLISSSKCFMNSEPLVSTDLSSKKRLQRRVAEIPNC